jgi:hypothetical protein
MANRSTADIPSVQRRDREALELAQRENISFEQAWRMLLDGYVPEQEWSDERR